MTLFLARTRTLINLGAVLGRGGEGAVYEIVGSPQQVAKIYTRSVDAVKAKKLSAMSEAADPRLIKIAAWPLDAVVDRVGQVRGFVMPRVGARSDIHELYSPKSRAQEFPEADFRFLVHVATNLARAVAQVHAAGHVIGDINHGSVFVGKDATVVLIDCDSIQFSFNGTLFTCDVGVPLFTAPELQEKNYRGLVRTANHDGFGLAVMIFHMLFMGRHPYAGRYLGRGDMPIEQAIKEFRFAYGSKRREQLMEAPPHAVDLSSMGGEIAGLFEQAFGRAGVVGRPQAVHWIVALEQLQRKLTKCTANSSHYYFNGLPSCPWCPIERAIFGRLFGQKIVAIPAMGAVSIGDIWKAISSIRGPGPAAPPPNIDPPNAGLTSGIATARVVGSLVAGFAGFVACSSVKGGSAWLGFIGLLVAVFLWPRERQKDRALISDANRHWNIVQAEWQKRCGEEVFVEKRRELERVKIQVEGLPKERARRMMELQSAREQAQRIAYLDRFRIDRATIPQIGLTRIAMLASYGIETAADIERNRVMNIPGFGRTLTGNLLDWRREQERGFRFNPNQPIDPKEVAVIDQDLRNTQIQLLATLRNGPAQLQRVVEDVVEARRKIRPLLEEAWIRKRSAELGLSN